MQEKHSFQLSSEWKIAHFGEQSEPSKSAYHVKQLYSNKDAKNKLKMD